MHLNPNAFRSIFWATSLTVASLLVVGYGCPQAAGTRETTAQPTPETTPALPVAAGLPQEGNKIIPTGGNSLLSSDPLSRLTFNGTPDQGSAAIVPVTGQPFSNALRLTAKVRPANIWSIQAEAPCTGSVKRGDVILVSFYIRCVEGQKETGEARTQFVFEQMGDPWTKYVEREIGVGKEWKQYFIPVEMRQDPPATGTHICFRMGYGPQVFEIADLKMVNYENAVKFADLPQTRSTYAGIEENAPWRQAANERIEKIRKGDVTIRVVNATGKPVQNVNLSLRMQKHAFGFGSAVSDGMIAQNGSDGDHYRDWVTKYCTKVVIENAQKWPQYEQNPEAAKHVVDWLNAHDVRVKGHNLIWPSWRNSPSDLPSLKGDKAKLAKRIDDHITSEVTAMKGKVVEWDVINEPFDNHDVMDILGNESMIHWFKLTKSLDPKPRLLLNDYPTLNGSAMEDAHLSHFYKTIQYLKDKGAPIEGIGFQCHFGGTMVPPKDILSGLDQFGKFGLPISVTEFDMNTNDDALKSAYMRDFMTVAFSHPQVDTILMWGFWEGAHWLPDAALYNRDWSVRPHGKIYEDLITKTWWTNANGITDTKGTFKTRGFYGDYQLIVTPSNVSKASGKTVPVSIIKGGKNVITVTL